MIPFSVIICTHRGPEGQPVLPHLKALRKSNPGVPVHICCKINNGDRQDEWRNSDRRFRDWWRKFAGCVKSDRIVILEWDVLVTSPIVLPDCAFAAKIVKTRESDPGWKWFEEAGALPEGMTPVGVVPLAVTYWTRAALDHLADSKFDAIFAKDLFCELRTGSVMATWTTVSEVVMPHVDWRSVAFDGGEGIYHAVKEEQPC